MPFPQRPALAAAALVSSLLALATACNRDRAAVASAASPPPVSTAEPLARHEVRVTGLVQAVRFVTIQVPQITTGQGGRLTLTKLIPNGSRVASGDVIAEFDRTQQLDNAREAQAKFEDLGHQVEQREAQNRADAEKRAADSQKAEADLAKATLQLQRGPLLSDIDRRKAEVKLQDARGHVESLGKSNEFHAQADTAALRILELQRDRQKVSLDRALKNADRLQVKAPLAGMVAYENVWRNNSMGNAQEGDQLWGGQPLMRIFDPSEMTVRASVGEPEGAALVPGCRATVRLDAYPELAFPARYDAGSPVAASALGSPIKTFTVMFRLEKSDPHILPDLSAAVTVHGPETPGPAVTR
jgi:HlyD family secretion protein